MAESAYGAGSLTIIKYFLEIGISLESPKAIKAIMELHPFSGVARIDNDFQFQSSWLHTNL